MRQIVIILVALLGYMDLVQAQTYDLISFYQKVWNKQVLPPRGKGLYLQDQSGVLDPFVGYWIGEFGNYTYEFFIHKLSKQAFTTSYVDRIDIDYNIYKTEPNGQVVLCHSTISTSAQFKVKPLKGFLPSMYTTTPSGYKYLNYELYYYGATKEQTGIFTIGILENGTLYAILREHYQYPSLKQEEQVFCISSQAKVGKGLKLTKRSDDPTIPTMRIPYQTYKHPLLLELITLQRMYGSKGYFNCFDSWMLDRLSLRYTITEIPSDHKRPWAEYGQVVARRYRDAEVFGRNRLVSYGLSFAEGFEHQSRLVRASRYFCLLVQCTMIEEMVKDLDEKGELGVLDHLIRTNFDSFDSSEPFTRYAELKGTTIAKLKEHYMQDGLKLLKLLFPKTSEAELRTALSNAIIDVGD